MKKDCKSCNNNIFLIKGKKFDDPEGSVEHRCVRKIKAHIIMTDSDKINACYNMLIRITQTLVDKQKI